MIERVQWCDEAERAIARALPPVTLALVAEEVRQGVSMLWRCVDSDHRAWCVTRVDENPRELVIVAFAGSGMMSFAPAFITASESRRIPMRAHTVSPVISRLVRRLGFHQSEFVLRRAS